MRPPYPTDPPTPTPPREIGGEIGLSTAHNGTQAARHAQLTAYSKGGLVTITPPPHPTQPRAGGGKRRAITGFSKHSRRRLLRLIGTIDQTATPPLFITLTYPATYPTARESKKHLKEFLRRLKTFYPSLAGIWKLEAQKRGAPHYHLLVWGVSYIPFQAVGRLWWNVTGRISPEHEQAGTQVCRAGMFRRVWTYAAKYLGKVCAAPGDATWDNPGRFWGIFSRDELPISPAYTFPLSDTEYYTLRRYSRRLQHRTAHTSQVNTVHHFSPHPARWVQVVFKHRQI